MFCKKHYVTMKQKITLLIFACIVTMAALGAIQGYFIYNTYQLREKEAKTLVTQKLLDVETSGKLDSINSKWMRKTGNFVVQFTNGKATKQDYLKLIKQTEDSLSRVMSEFIDMKGLVSYYDVTYSNYVTLVIMEEAKTKELDTLYKGQLLLFTNNSEGAKEIKASESRWSGATTDIDPEAKLYNFVVVTTRYYTISNWNSEVLWKMSGLLAFSVLLFMLVIGLFYWSIKNLITQKKLADVKTDFINNITHEFQTPLAALDIAVKTLKHKEAELTAQQFDTSLAIIDRQNQRMQKLFGQVSEASVGVEGIETTKAELLGKDEIQQVIDDFALSRPQAAIKFKADTDATIYIDRFHLATILNNLLDNAVKYGADVIDVSLEQNISTTGLRVKDNGRGIAPKDQQAIFEKFYRVDKGNIHNTKGLGLGLFYVKQIVTAYGGEISVASKEGKGSIFTIILSVI